MQKDKKLEENKALFKAIKKDEIRIVTKQKVNINFVLTKSYYLQSLVGKKNRIDWLLCKKCACNHPLD